jgi:hypothetical protein
MFIFVLKKHSYCISTYTPSCCITFHPITFIPTRPHLYRRVISQFLVFLTAEHMVNYIPSELFSLAPNLLTYTNSGPSWPVIVLTLLYPSGHRQPCLLLFRINLYDICDKQGVPFLSLSRSNAALISDLLTWTLIKLPFRPITSRYLFFITLWRALWGRFPYAIQIYTYSHLLSAYFGPDYNHIIFLGDI